MSVSPPEPRDPGSRLCLLQLPTTGLWPPLPLEWREQTPDKRPVLLGAFMSSSGLPEDILLRIVVFCDVNEEFEYEHEVYWCLELARSLVRLSSDCLRRMLTRLILKIVKKTFLSTSLCAVTSMTSCMICTRTWCTSVMKFQ